MKYLFLGVFIDDGKAADYIPKVDNKIKRIKELYRAVKHRWPWRLSIGLEKQLVCGQA